MYGAVPPFAVKVMVPLLPPLQLTLIVAVLALNTINGCVIVPDAVVEQPLLSVMVAV